MLLTLVYTLIAVSLIIVAVDATAVHLARTQLWDAADAAALDAADAVDGPGVYGVPASRPVRSPGSSQQPTPTAGSSAPPSGPPKNPSKNITREGPPAPKEGTRPPPGPGDALILTDRSVRERAVDYLTTYQPPSRLTDVHLGPRTGSPDGRGAQVELTGTVRLPIGGAVVSAWAGGITITVHSHAQARLG